MDLKDKWNSLTREQKGLIGLAVVIIIVILYAYHPIIGTPTDNSTINTTPNQQQSAAVPMPFTQSGSNNTTVSNNTTTSNGTNQITADQAKNIATQARQGYTAQQPSQGSVTVNGVVTSVWIVPLSKNNAVSKTLYIDVNNGKIVQET